MLPTTFLAIVLVLWSSFHLLHNFIVNNTEHGLWLNQFLDNRNILVSPFHIKWFTRRWNKCFIHIGRFWKLKFWFNSGVIFAFITMFVSVGLLVHTLINCLQDLTIPSKQQTSSSPQVLTVIVPGVNMEIYDMGYLISAVLISGILHELGHAIAAIREGVQVNGFGIFLFVIYPGAYVDLNSEDLSRANPRQQLRIYCAGIWHNFIICLSVCALIFSLPVVLFPFYSTSDTGVLVTHQTDNSPLSANNGLHIGDKVKSIGRCTVTDLQSWYQCINDSASLSQMGSCVSLQKIRKFDYSNRTALNQPMPFGQRDSASSQLDCCGKDAPQTHLCYSFVLSKSKFMACLPARVMMSHRDCINQDDCANQDKSLSSADQEICTFPYQLAYSMRLMRIVVSRGQSKHHVLYVGKPNDLLRFVTVSDYAPRLAVFPLHLPAMFLKFLQYMFSMSGALALLNIVPCYALDGQWAFKAFVDHFFDKDTVKAKDLICSIVLSLGTILIAANVIFGFIHIFSR